MDRSSGKGTYTSSSSRKRLIHSPAQKGSKSSRNLLVAAKGRGEPKRGKMKNRKGKRKETAIQRGKNARFLLIEKRQDRFPRCY